MPTLSFNAEFSTVQTESESPVGGYKIKLDGDQGTPSEEEYDCVTGQTPRALISFQKAKASTLKKIQMRGEPSELDVLRSGHYTWHIERSDHKPMAYHELSFALAADSMRRFQEKQSSENVVSLTLTALDRLLNATAGERNSFIAGLEEDRPNLEEIWVEDEMIAAGLVAHGLIKATDESGYYVLQDVRQKFVSRTWREG